LVVCPAGMDRDEVRRLRRLPRSGIRLSSGLLRNLVVFKALDLLTGVWLWIAIVESRDQVEQGGNIGALLVYRCSVGMAVLIDVLGGLLVMTVASGFSSYLARHSAESDTDDSSEGSSSASEGQGWSSGSEQDGSSEEGSPVKIARLKLSSPGGYSSVDSDEDGDWQRKTGHWKQKSGRRKHKRRDKNTRESGDMSKKQSGVGRYEDVAGLEDVVLDEEGDGYDDYFYSVGDASYHDQSEEPPVGGQDQGHPVSYNEYYHGHRQSGGWGGEAGGNGGGSATMRWADPGYTPQTEYGDSAAVEWEDEPMNGQPPLSARDMVRSGSVPPLQPPSMAGAGFSAAAFFPTLSPADFQASWASPAFNNPPGQSKVLETEVLHKVGGQGLSPELVRVHLESQGFSVVASGTYDGTIKLYAYSTTPHSSTQYGSTFLLELVVHEILAGSLGTMPPVSLRLTFKCDDAAQMADHVQRLKLGELMGKA